MTKEAEFHKKFPLKGVITGCDNRTPEGYRRVVRLRETAYMWIDPRGERWWKKTGYRVGTHIAPLYKIRLLEAEEVPSNPINMGNATAD